MEFLSFLCDKKNSQSWLIQAQSKGVLTEEIVAEVKNRDDMAYRLGALFSYQSEDVANRLVSFLKTAPILLTDLQAMERTAKARGNIELGRQLHQIFESRNKSNDFVAAGVLDAWNDPIYFKRGSASEKAWRLGQRELASGSQSRRFTQTLAYFVEVEIKKGVTSEVLSRFAAEVPKHYSKGIPVPPLLRILAKDDQHAANDKDEDSARYISALDQVTVVQWADDSYFHELGHFVMDLLDDQNVPNKTYAIPRLPNGALLFDPDRCNLLESVSRYGGQCNAERKDGMKKEHEDPAETFLWLQRIGRINPPEETVLHPEKVLRDQKIKWAAQILDYLAPRVGEPARPNPKRPPWKAPELKTASGKE